MIHKKGIGHNIHSARKGCVCVLTIKTSIQLIQTLIFFLYISLLILLLPPKVREEVCVTSLVVTVA